MRFDKFSARLSNFSGLFRQKMHNDGIQFSKYDKGCDDTEVQQFGVYQIFSYLVCRFLDIYGGKYHKIRIIRFPSAKRFKSILEVGLFQFALYALCNLYVLRMLPFVYFNSIQSKGIYAYAYAINISTYI